jgi:hypothetical protein
MSTRDDILDQVKEQLEDKLHSSDPNGYYTSDIAEVRRGDHHFEDMVNRPALGVQLVLDELDEEVFASTGNDQVRFLQTNVYGYVDVSMEDYDDLHTLVRDVEYFFKYDFSDSSVLEVLVGNIDTLEGGVRYPVSYFNMELQIKYMNRL